VRGLPANADAWAVLIGILLCSTLLIIRMFSQGPRVRRLLAIASIAVLVGSVLTVCGIVYLATHCPSKDPNQIPYENLGSFKTTDLDGNPCQVNVEVKYLGYMIPPGVLPRLKLLAVSKEGTDTTIYDTHWRFGAACVRPANGGMDVLSQRTPEKGLRFLIRSGHWLANPEVIPSVAEHE